MSPRIGLQLDTILETAAHLLNQEGLEHISMGTLAKELNIKTPSLYNHVNGLQDLRQKLAIYGLKKLYNSMLRSAIGLSGDEAVYSVSRAYVDFARMNPGLYDASNRAADKNDPELHDAQNAIVQLVIKVLDIYGFEREHILHMVRGLRSILHGFAAIEMAGGFGMPLDIDKSISLTVNTFLSGMKSLKTK
ncbi:TetR/AcrR family transcriptional regulator [Peribacillus sp. SCS-155]|uniref:TetR/AcrR family transcriptional regulator n=1 Tax=Peribacillus sedimenti TaxID=3115297 RepID=UPI003905CE18